LKLFSKYYRVNLITTIVVMLFTGIVYYWAITMILKGQENKDLAEEEQEVFSYVNTNHQLPPEPKSNSQHTTFTVVNSPVKRKFVGSVFRNEKEGENEPGRGLITNVTVNGIHYKVFIVESSVETDDLIQIIFGITIGVILILLAILFMVNKLVLSRIWQPFYSILEQLKSFNVSNKAEIIPQRSTIEEFTELNNAVLTMSSRVKSEYNDLKAFTENASHELLTPLAIINSKLDTLVQTDSFSERQSALLNDLYTSVSRLTRLNQAMLLLSRIENQLIPGTEPVELDELINDNIIQLHELYTDKDIRLTVNLVHKTLNANKYLIEVLVSNLLINAIRHNVSKGEIAIMLTDEKLVVENTGIPQDLSGQNIFKRFNKSAGSEGSGLGLTISNQICENYGFRLSYAYKQNKHAFMVNFKLPQAPDFLQN